MHPTSVRILLTLVLLAVIVAGAVYAYVTLGYAPVATASAPLPMETWLAHTALKAAIHRGAPTSTPPVEANEPAIVAGARIYREQCAVCHGLPSQQESHIAKGMFPHPPQLFKGHGVTDDPVGETYWIVENGVRLTGMPGFKNLLTEDQIWQVAQMLAHADKLPPAATLELQRP